MHFRVLTLYLLKLLFLFIFIVVCTKSEDDNVKLDADPNGYIIFCLCMGRIGNQIEHLLGGMDFAKRMNRTLILPTFRHYSVIQKNIPFDEWFNLEKMEAFHRVIPAELFMQNYAPHVWPVPERYAFCWSHSGEEGSDCRMKEGSPFGPFWDGLGVDFVRDINYDDISKPEGWNSIYPPASYPVIAMRGAPASFPMKLEHWPLQKHLVLSESIQRQADEYIRANFNAKSFIGIHLRNGFDWVKACERAAGLPSYMASPQCLHASDRVVTKNMCLPSKAEVLRLTKSLVMQHQIRVIFVATDRNPMIKDITDHLSDKNVQVFHADPSLALIDWAILLQSDYFIGNCISSFTSFVKRSRDVQQKPTIFWGLDE